MWETNPNLKLDENGMDLCERYFYQVGLPMLEERFGDELDHIAAGLVGEGSECFGFDDAISTDHDWGPSFCLWLTDKDYDRFGAQLAAAYDELPEEFEGRRFARHREQAAGRRGVLRISSFYAKFLGRPTVPESPLDWLRLPESYLAVATNGKVFADPVGEFSRIRNALLGFYPEDVRRKKLAAQVATMAHTGQANFCRVMARFDTVAASMARAQFIEAAMKVTYLLNHRYALYYKWMWRGLRELSVLPEMPELIRQLAEAPLDAAAWKNVGSNVSTMPPNTADASVNLMEKICALVAGELTRQGLSNATSTYLEDHAYAVQASIESPQVRGLNLLLG